MESVRLWPIELELSDFGETFDPLKLDHVNGEAREKTRECELKVLRKVVDLSNQHLVRNANWLLTKRPHNEITSKITCGLGKKEKTRLRNLLFPVEK